jgi:hypothetical protein
LFAGLLIGLASGLPLAGTPSPSLRWPLGRCGRLSRRLGRRCGLAQCCRPGVILSAGLLSRNQGLVWGVFGTNGETDLVGRDIDALGMVVERNGDLLLENVELDHFAHAGRRTDALANLRQRSAHLAVDLVLEREAAEQSSADAGDAVRVERQVLVLGHANADVGEIGHPTGTTKPQSADVIAIDEARALSLIGLLHVQGDFVLFLDLVEQGSVVNVLGCLEPGGPAVAVEIQFDRHRVEAEIVADGG